MNTTVAEDYIQKNDNTAISVSRALFFVIGTYLLLIISAGLTILIGVGVVLLIGYVCARFLNRIPVGVILTISLGVLVGVLAMFRGIVYSLKPRKSFYPAFAIKKEEQNELMKFISELCNKMNTKVPDYILLHAEPTFFVQQGKVSTLGGVVKGRILAIGMPLLSYLEKKELRAILAHEFAHFTGKDTVYSSYILPVYQSTLVAIENMEAYFDSDNDNGWIIVPMILPRFILRAYYNAFNSSNMKRSREREKRADIIACNSCGSEDFKNALTKTVCITGVFNGNSKSQILDMYKDGKVYINYYEYLRNCDESVMELSERYKRDALRERTREDSSHPSFSDRIRYIPKIERKYLDDDAAINLINNAEEYEKALTENYSQYLAIINGISTQ